MSSTPSYFQPREFSTCVSCEESPSCLDQIFESYLQTETLSGPLLNSTQSAPHYFPDSCQVAPFCYNQSLVIHLHPSCNLMVANCGVEMLCRSVCIISWEKLTNVNNKEIVREAFKVQCVGPLKGINLWIHTYDSWVNGCLAIKRSPGAWCFLTSVRHLLIWKSIV